MCAGPATATVDPDGGFTVARTYLSVGGNGSVWDVSVAVERPVREIRHPRDWQALVAEAPRAAGFPPFSSLERSPLVLPPFYAPDFARLRSTTSGIRYTLSGLVRGVLVASSVEDGRTAMIPSDVNVECTTWLQARLAHAKRIL